MKFQVMGSVGEFISRHLPAKGIKTLKKENNNNNKGRKGTSRAIKESGIKDEGLSTEIFCLGIFPKCQ